MIKLQEKKINKNKDEKSQKIQKLLSDGLLIFKYYPKNKYR